MSQHVSSLLKKIQVAAEVKQQTGLLIPHGISNAATSSTQG
jgi:hypothetical protein